MQRRFIYPLLGLVLAVGLASAAVSEDTKPGGKTDSRESGKSGASKDKFRAGRDLPAFTSEREAAALTFIGLHHAEMAELLRQLKGTDLAEYRREIRVLFRSSEHLADLKDKDAELYELELRGWILDSRIRLLAARLSMAASESVEQELRQALSEQIDVRIAQQTLTRRRLESRLADMNSQIEKLEQSRDEQIERRMKSLLSGKPPRAKSTGKNRDE
jgi:hypothetical protein